MNAPLFLQFFCFQTHTLPYMKKTNDTYEGLLHDLLSLLADDLGFTFTIEEFNDYGHFDKDTQEWTGMVGKIAQKVKEINVILYSHLN